ncbi:MAG TPA: MerR family transcriptional regulator [Bryobacteraceae bacterium]|nr:MerR family transcriptional regulator [Bryobacteraceae bacterium]HPT29000.1 MerR family transcriptional regulator [Bryobacteraceae bacterium]
MATAAVSARVDPVEIPNKLYFRIGDVSKLASVKPYVLRFWESEFPMLNPKKSGANQRLYRRKDVETILEIKHLLYEKRFTIEGARSYLQQQRSRSGPKTAPKPAPKQTGLFPEMVKNSNLARIRQELSGVLDLLSR